MGGQLKELKPISELEIPVPLPPLSDSKPKKSGIFGIFKKKTSDSADKPAETVKVSENMPEETKTISKKSKKTTLTKPKLMPITKNTNIYGNDLIKQHAIIKEHEKNVMASQKQLSRDKHKWVKEQMQLKKSIDVLNKKKVLSEKDLLKKEEIFKKILSKKEHELKIQFEEIKRKREILNSDKEMLLKNEKKIIERKKELNNLEEIKMDLNHREQKVDLAEKDLISKQMAKQKLEEEIKGLTLQKEDGIIQIEKLNSLKETNTLKLNEIKDAKAENDKKNKQAIQNTKILFSQEKKAIKKLKELREKSKVVDENTEILFRLKDEIKNNLKERVDNMSALKSEWNEINAHFINDKKELKSHNKIIEGYLEKSEDMAQMLKKREEEILKKERKNKQVIQNTKILFSQEKKAIKKLKELREKSKVVDENTKLLFRLKDEIKNNLKERVDNMSALKSEWNEINALFANNKKDLTDHNKIIEEYLQKSENAADVLKKVEKKEEYIKKNLDKLDNIEKRENDVKEKEEQVKEYTNLKKKIDEFNKHLNVLKITYNTLNKKIIEKNNALMNINDEIKFADTQSPRESEMLDRIPDNNEPLRKAESRQRVIVAPKIKIQEKQIKPATKTREPVSIQTPNYDEIYAEISEAKRLVQENMIKEAIVKVKNIQTLQRKSKLESDIKRKISYDLMDLDTDIKLASI